MTAEEFIKKGEVKNALTELKKQIQKKPADGKLRVFLYQLFCIMGDYSRALTQLTVCTEMKAMDGLNCAAGKMLLQNEALREEVFQGERTPLIFGEPQEWISLMLQALAFCSKDNFTAAEPLRNKAFDAAEATQGTINGEAFEWIADADSRIGPCLEVVVEGKYYWLPFSGITSVEINPVAEMRDLVWAESTVVLNNGGKVFAYLPARYPGVNSDSPESIMLGRQTDWIEQKGQTWIGQGQKMLVTDKGDYPLLEIRTITINNG